MADLNTFKAQFPEFAAAGLNDPLINAYLNAAMAEVDATSINNPAASDQIVYLTTAQMLALSPSGNTAKLANDDGTTVYDAPLKRWKRKVAGPIVAV